MHWFSNDLQGSPSGDVMLVEGTVKGQQLVVRRLLTNILNYFFEQNYGGGLAAYVGTPTGLQAVEGVDRQQLYLESSVAQTPAPTISITAITNGINVSIQYVDANTGAPSVLNFDVNA